MINDTTHISAQITGIEYQICCSKELQKIDVTHFDINQVPSSCILTNAHTQFGISKWVSPKRTRSYPYERVYDTLQCAKKITVIPVIKDEGAMGDRDFLQWDTISLMSLLDVFVIFAYYIKAEKRGNKITRQQFDNAYVLAKIKAIQQYHSSALHWNLNELNQHFSTIIQRAKIAYKNIEKMCNVKLHDSDGIDKLKAKIEKDISTFMRFSRDKAAKAQLREIQTIQPKEQLSTLSKTSITISNYLGGKYFFTVDEIDFKNKKLFLIESKHSKKSLLPSIGDIKDGLIKMILYTNLCKVKMGNQGIKTKAILSLSSQKLRGNISSLHTRAEVSLFCRKNKLNANQIHRIETIIHEAKSNHFITQIYGTT